ncbi:hypothetical protein CALCODRAFT_3445 [Calocera cornea HHB12733]|uniref:Uncharacterized protein n=1 Tax=Calocera cornea HHB12733 TaxID=1353952 RepID=A0A165K9U5_9BASI|nr:hypothetical protein CALCODRAFT_3445 [Calocera cornea HHB12733]
MMYFSSILRAYKDPNQLRQLASAHDTLRRGLSLSRSRALSPASSMMSPPRSPLLQLRSPITPTSIPRTTPPARNSMIAPSISPASSLSATPLLLPSFGLAGSQLTALSNPFLSDPGVSTTPLNSPPNSPGRLKYLTSFFSTPAAPSTSPMSPRILRTQPTSTLYSSHQQMDVSTHKADSVRRAMSRNANDDRNSRSHSRPHRNSGSALGLPRVSSYLQDANHGQAMSFASSLRRTGSLQAPSLSRGRPHSRSYEWSYISGDVLPSSLSHDIIPIERFRPSISTTPPGSPSVPLTQTGRLSVVSDLSDLHAATRSSYSPNSPGSATTCVDKLARYRRFHQEMNQVLSPTALEQFNSIIHAFSNDNVPLSGPSGVLRQGKALLEAELGKTAYSARLVEEFESIIREDSGLTS